MIHERLGAFYQKLGQIRTQHSFLRTGSFDTLLADDTVNALAYGRKPGTMAVLQQTYVRQVHKGDHPS